MSLFKVQSAIEPTITALGMEMWKLMGSSKCRSESG